MAHTAGGNNVVEWTSRTLTLAEAAALLAGAHRGTLSDSSFGDAEVWWMMDDRQVAEGYFGRRSYVTFLATPDYAVTSFEGEQALKLRHLCCSSEHHSNNDPE
ncbi:MAG: hypothetical protein V1846_03375 [Candidatus Komeilibacteria bacterium]